MALEIGEISVRMAVEEQHRQQQIPAPAGDTATLAAAQHEQIVNECVRQVLLALQRQQAR